MLGSRFVALITLPSALAVLTCAPAETAKPAAPAPVEAPGPQSSEWLYVTETVRGGRKAECDAVFGAIGAESKCKGELCRHGVKLADDWLRVCKAHSPGRVAEIERRHRELGENVQKRFPCEEEIGGLLREGCGARQDCAAFAQSWATRCSDYTTPLVIRMVEIMVERKSGGRVRIDPRSCSELLGAVVSAAVCENQFACRDALGSIDVYRQRCESEQQPSTLAGAIAELSIRVGAGENPKPVPVMLGSKIEAESLPLVLADGSGAVLRVCGQRPRELAQYLEARKGCSQDVVLARRFAGNDGTAVVRVGRAPHASDALFWQRFPGLALDGERSRREEPALAAFSAALDRVTKLALDAKAKPEAIGVMVDRLITDRSWLASSKAFEQALAARDEGLVELFRSIGEAKRAAIHADLDDRAFMPPIQRAQRHALADVSALGRARIGESTLASGIDFNPLLPKSMAAYGAALEPRFRSLSKRKLLQKQRDKLAEDAGQRVARCAQAAAGAGATEAALVACVFGIEDCDEARMNSLGEKLDQARRDFVAAWTEAALAIASQGEENREAALASARAGGCREPW